MDLPLAGNSLPVVDIHKDPLAYPEDLEVEGSRLGCSPHYAHSRRWAVAGSYWMQDSNSAVYTRQLQSWDEVETAYNAAR